MPCHKKKFNDQQFNSLLREKKICTWRKYASLFVGNTQPAFVSTYCFHVQLWSRYLFYPAEIIHIHNLFLTAFIKVCIEKSRVCIIMNFIWPDFVILKKLISIRSCCGLRTRSSFLTLFTLNLTGDCGAVWALTGAWHHRIHTSLMSSHESSPLVSCCTLERGSWEGGGGLHAAVMTPPRHPSFLMSSYPCRRHSSDNCLQLMGARKICRSDLILAQERSSGDVRSEQRAATRFFSNSQNIFILFVFICFYFHESINTWA